MRVFCVHLSRYATSQAMAIYDTQWRLTPATRWWGFLQEMHESIKHPLAFEFYCVQNMIYICVTGHDDEIDFVVSALYGIYSSCEIKEIEDYTQQIDPNSVIVSSQMHLKGRDVLPTRDQSSMEHDTVGVAFNVMAPFIPVLSKTPGNDRILVQVVVRPCAESAMHHFSLLCGRMAERASRAVNPRFWMKKDLNVESYKKMKEKCNSKLFWFSYRVAALCPMPPNASAAERKEATHRLTKVITEYGNTAQHLNQINENGYVMGRIEHGIKPFEKFRRRALIAPRRATGRELAAIWLIPLLPTVPNTAQVVSEKGPPPKSLPISVDDPQVSFFGHTNYRDQNVAFGVRRYDRRRHMYVLGKSGSGKSCLMQLLVKNDIDNGYGCAVLDPHGDLVDDILKIVPKHRAKDVVLFDPSDMEYPPSFNPLSAVRPELKMRATIGFIEVFRRILGADWTDKMDHVIRYSMLALLQIPGSSMLSMRKIMTDAEYRAAVLEKVEDEQVRRFWLQEFAVREREFEGDISRILNKLDQLLATDMVRNIVGQPMNLFDFREFMDSRKIVLIKVSKGILGAENAQLLGSLIIAKVYEAAMSRADIPSESRQDFYFYVDEFQNFATESFGEILSESRKYRLSLTFANQYLGQLPASTRQTVFGNVGNILAFRVGGGDAAVLADEFKPRFSAEDIMNLGARDFYVKMSIDGEVQEAFSGRTLELHTPLESEHFAKECVRLSRSKYCLPIEHAEEALNFSEYGVYERDARAEEEAGAEGVPLESQEQTPEA